MDRSETVELEGVEVQQETWVDFIDRKLQQLSPLSNWSISRVPYSLRVVNEDAYSPHIISIGPLHHRSEHLQSMEVHKLYYMQSLLRRTPNTRETLSACANQIEEFNVKVSDCYSEPFDMGASEFSAMLLVDGCFILELFLKYSIVDLRLQDDPIFNTSWMILALQRDLALLENQIPFFVLEWLFEHAVTPSAIGQSVSTLPELALDFFKPVLHRSEQQIFRVSRRQFPHLLGLIHSCYLPSTTPPSRSRGGERVLLEGASAIIDTGLAIKRDTTRNLFDLQFQNGTIKIPPLIIHESTVSIFQNLIAYEQLFQSSAQYVTSYFILMARFAGSTSRDAELLEHRGIIESNLGAWQDVSSLFSSMCREVVLKDFYYAELCEQVNSHYKTQWQAYKAALRRDYFGNPWTAVSVVAASMLLTLVAVQTIYAVLSYYPR